MGHEGLNHARANQALSRSQKDRHANGLLRVRLRGTLRPAPAGNQAVNN